MLDPFSHSHVYVKLQMRERYAQADRDRLARHATLPRERRLRRRLAVRVGMALVAVGELLAGPTVETVCADGSVVLGCCP